MSPLCLSRLPDEGRPMAGCLPGKIVSVNTADEGGGAERIAWTLFEGYRRRAIDSWLVVGDRKTNDPQVMPFFLSPHIDYRPYARWWRQARLRLRKWACRRLGRDDFEFPYSRHLLSITGSCPDLVHCHNLHGGYFDLRALIDLSRRVRVFLTVHDTWLLSSVQAVRSRILRQCRLYVSAPSRWMLDQVERSDFAPALLDSRLIPNGIDLRLFRPGSRSTARSALPVPQEGDLLLFVAIEAATNPLKDLTTIRQALGRLAAQRGSRPVHLVVVGDVRPNEVLGNATIQYVGRLYPRELVRYYQAADLYVHAAISESFGLVIAEAMACGTPVIATAVGGIPELYRDGREGLLVPGGDATALASAIRRLLEAPELRKMMGQRATRWAHAHFDQEKMIDSYLAWFAEKGPRVA